MIAEYLRSLGITHCFGIIGGGNVSLWHELSQSLVMVCTHHEQAAAMAATYYYRTCKRLAPVIVTTGGGSVNAITGVMAAYMDGMPLLVISGNEKSTTMHNNTRALGVQGYRSDLVAEPFTKYSCNIEIKSEVIDRLRVCISVAMQPRRGPVWLNIPQDFQR